MINKRLPITCIHCIHFNWIINFSNFLSCLASSNLLRGVVTSQFKLSSRVVAKGCIGIRRESLYSLRHPSSWWLECWPCRRAFLSFQWGRVRGDQTHTGEEHSQVTFSGCLPGICSELILKPENVSQEELLDITDQLNMDPRISGILVQLPLPGTWCSFVCPGWVGERAYHGIGGNLYNTFRRGLAIILAQ